MVLVVSPLHPVSAHVNAHARRTAHAPHMHIHARSLCLRICIELAPPSTTAVPHERTLRISPSVRHIFVGRLGDRDKRRALRSTSVCRLGAAKAAATLRTTIACLIRKATQAMRQASSNGGVRPGARWDCERRLFSCSKRTAGVANESPPNYSPQHKPLDAKRNQTPRWLSKYRRECFPGVCYA